MIKGIDVSSWQGDIDWNKVYNDGYEFAVIRSVVYGSRYKPSYIDPLFLQNWQKAKAAGLRVSSYYVHRPDLNAQMQVDNFLQTIHALENDLPWVFDVELDGGMSPSAITAHLWRCLELFEKEHDKPIIYTGAWFWNPNILRNPEWSQYKLWTASYTVNPFIPSDWADYYIWQHTNKGQVDGIIGDVDLNKMKVPPSNKLVFDIPESPVYSGLGLDARSTESVSGQIQGKRAWVQIEGGWVKVENDWS